MKQLCVFRLNTRLSRNKKRLKQQNKSRQPPPSPCARDKDLHGLLEGVSSLPWAVPPGHTVRMLMISWKSPHLFLCLLMEIYKQGKNDFSDTLGKQAGWLMNQPASCSHVWMTFLILHTLLVNIGIPIIALTFHDAICNKNRLTCLCNKTSCGLLNTSQ